MNWLERGRREIQKYARQPTANSAERTPTAAMAVPPRALRERLEESIGSNGSTVPAEMRNAEAAGEELDANRQALRTDKPELMRLLLLDRIEVAWKPGEWLAYRDAGQLLTAKYAGTSTAGMVNLWLADGALRAVPPESVAFDWCPDAAEVFEERLCIMLEAGVPEEEARPRAEACIREYFARLPGGRA